MVTILQSGIAALIGNIKMNSSLIRGRHHPQKINDGNLELKGIYNS